MTDTVTSMTGFARAGGEADWGSWTWEAKSVNGRGLDLRVNVPGGFDGLDQAVKKAASAMFSRGNMQIGLRIEMSASAETISVNEAAFKAIRDAFERANDGPPDSGALATLMSLKGVIETGSQSLRDLATEDGVQDMLLASAMTALDSLAEARATEGTAMRSLLLGHIAEMSATLANAEDLAATQPGLLKARLEKQIAELDTANSVDADRMAAEIALSAAKADVREEIDRLSAHIASARNLIEQGGAIGRKLDFMAQEFNREANTLCSKSVSLELTNCGLAIKGLIDQFKEQAANVE